MQGRKPVVREDRLREVDWEGLGEQILRVAQDAIRLQREEEQITARATSVPFLRLVREEESGEIEAGVRGDGFRGLEAM